MRFLIRVPWHSSLQLLQWWKKRWVGNRGGGIGLLVYVSVSLMIFNCWVFLGHVTSWASLSDFNREL